MSVRVEDNRIIIEFSLTQPKRSWKVRRPDRVRSANIDAGFEISSGDLFEWMVTNDEIRDILSALKCVSRETYEEIKSKVNMVREYIDWNRPPENIIYRGVVIERVQRPKQRKRTELTPYFFILIPLDRQSEMHYIVDKRGKHIHNIKGYRVKPGDKLVLIPDHQFIEKIVIEISRLSEKHHEGIRKALGIVNELNNDQCPGSRI